MTAGNAAEVYGFELLNSLRQKNIAVTMDFASRSMKAQMKQAAKSGAKFALIIGDDEVNEKSVTVKNLETSAQEKFSSNDVIKILAGSE